jgi:hypothetical protein
MSLVLQSSGGGSVTIQEPTTASNFTATMPAATGTVMVSGNMPAFSAYLGTNQSVSSSTYTKIQCNTEEFDTNSSYDNATNYRFQPTIAGYYQINIRVDVGTSSITACVAAIYKNGSAFKFGSSFGQSATIIFTAATASALVYLNGSTDYIEAYGYVTATTPVFYAGQNATYFQAAMVRSA